MKIGIIILCRTSSIRLPQKALIKINNISIIDYVIKIAKNVIDNKKIIISTSLFPEDDILEKIAHQNNIGIFRGDLENVYERFYQTMEQFDLDHAIRLNGDSPLNHHSIIEKAIGVFSKNHKADIVTNIFPRTYPKGMSAEIISKILLKSFRNKIVDKMDFENVTSFFYKNHNLFQIINFSSQNEYWNKYNLSIDDKFDATIIKDIIKKFPDYYNKKTSYKEIIHHYEKIKNFQN